ncbi:MAG: hypothetical protein HKN43_02380 [Rhodothermales bacterium]|nr:hypothetical protein [Rhodothermales bacterium]
MSQLLARIRQPTYSLALLVVIIGASTRHFAGVEPYEEGVGCQMQNGGPIAWVPPFISGAMLPGDHTAIPGNQQSSVLLRPVIVA